MNRYALHFQFYFDNISFLLFYIFKFVKNIMLTVLMVVFSIPCYLIYQQAIIQWLFRYINNQITEKESFNRNSQVTLQGRKPTFTRQFTFSFYRYLQILQNILKMYSEMPFYYQINLFKVNKFYIKFQKYTQSQYFKRKLVRTLNNYCKEFYSQTYPSKLIFLP